MGSWKIQSWDAVNKVAKVTNGVLTQSIAIPDRALQDKQLLHDYLRERCDNIDNPPPPQGEPTPPKVDPATFIGQDIDLIKDAPDNATGNAKAAKAKTNGG